jgi:hypothetical protein
MEDRMNIGSEFAAKKQAAEVESLKKEVSKLKQEIGDYQHYIAHLKKHREFSLFSAIMNAKMIARPDAVLISFADSSEETAIAVQKMTETFDKVLYPNKLDFTKENNNA